MQSLTRLFRPGKQVNFVGILFLISLSMFGRFTIASVFGSNVGKLKERRDIVGLAGALEAHDPEVQFRAAEALGDIGDARSVAPLVNSLKTSEFEGVRWKSAEALSKIGDPAVGPLITLLRHPVDDVRWKAALALGEIGNPEAIEPLITLLDDDDRYVRSRAGHALGLIGEPALDRLANLIRDGNPRRRWGAAIALGRTGSGRAVEPLIGALGDSNDEVRTEAATALAIIGRPAVEPLIRFLKFSRGETRIEVIRALGDLHADDAIQPLVQLLETAGDREQKAISDALSAILVTTVGPMVEDISHQHVPAGKLSRSEGEDGEAE
jgi:HEAT repeat protein